MVEIKINGTILVVQDIRDNVVTVANSIEVMNPSICNMLFEHHLWSYSYLANGHRVNGYRIKEGIEFEISEFQRTPTPADEFQLLRKPMPMKIVAVRYVY